MVSIPLWFVSKIFFPILWVLKGNFTVKKKERKIAGKKEGERDRNAKTGLRLMMLLLGVVLACRL